MTHDLGIYQSTRTLINQPGPSRISITGSLYLAGIVLAENA